MAGPRTSPGKQWRDAVRLRRHARDLAWLGRYFGTDKAGPLHRYTQHYQALFEPIRDEHLVLLEIGVGGYRRTGEGGESLRMWKHYFRRAQIVGLDLQDKRFVEEPRIRVYQGDQSDPAVLRRIVDEVGRPTIVIDDGSHYSHHVLATFAVMFPLLKNKGFYVIEDTQTSYWPEWYGAADRQASGTTMSLVKNLVDGLNYEEFVDDDYQPSYTDRHVREVHCFHNLVVVKKGRNAEGTRKAKLLKEQHRSKHSAPG